MTRHLAPTRAALLGALAAAGALACDRSRPTEATGAAAPTTVPTPDAPDPARALGAALDDARQRLAPAIHAAPAGALADALDAMRRALAAGDAVALARAADDADAVLTRGAGSGNALAAVAPDVEAVRLTAQEARRHAAAHGTRRSR